MNFSRDDEAKLCELVSNHPSLYDYSDSNFKDIHMKDNIWREVATAFNGKTGKLIFIF